MPYSCKKMNKQQKREVAHEEHPGDYLGFGTGRLLHTAATQASTELRAHALTAPTSGTEQQHL